jgi:hypothetical protein
MKYSKQHIAGALLLAALTSLALSTVVQAGEFSVKEYNDFHDLLHPLQHEALPAKDFQRIRSSGGELVKRGQAIIRVGVPKAVGEKQVEGFRRELRKFEGVLKEFSDHSKSGSDEQLKASFGAVHDSFEMLAGMLPRQ